MESRSETKRLAMQGAKLYTQAELNLAVAGAYLDAAAVKCYGCNAKVSIGVKGGETYHDWTGFPGQRSTGDLALSHCTALEILARTPADAKAAWERRDAEREYLKNEVLRLKADWIKCDIDKLATIERLQSELGRLGNEHVVAMSQILNLQAQLKELEGIDKVCDHSNETIGLLQADVERLTAENECSLMAANSLGDELRRLTAELAAATRYLQWALPFLPATWPCSYSDTLTSAIEQSRAYSDNLQAAMETVKGRTAAMSDAPMTPSEFARELGNITDEDVEKLITEQYAAIRREAQAEAFAELRDLVEVVKKTRTAWLEQHGVPISQEFVDFATAIGNIQDMASRLSQNPAEGAK